MPNSHKAWTETVTWEQVRAQVMALNPELAAAIDKVSPSKEDVLYLMHYPFGAKIVDSGIGFIPTNDGGVAPLGDPQIPSAIAQNLQRRFLPVSFILDKSAEIFFNVNNNVIPVNYLERGSFFGLWEALDTTSQSYYIKDIWNISAGARSLFLVPKTTDASSYMGLRSFYKLRSKSPKNNYGHWETFVEIANSPSFAQAWTTDILVFPDTWLDKIMTVDSWLPLKAYCLEYCWKQSQCWRNKVSFDFVWKLSTELMGGHLKPNPYHASLVKHLSLIGASVLPGFAVANDNNQAAPITGLKQAYTTHYKSKDYIPIFMAPKYLSAEDNIPVYFSFQSPGLLESPPYTRKIPSIRNAMLEVSYVTETFRLEILEGNIKLKGTPVETFANHVVCEFYHNDVSSDSHHPLQPTRQLFLNDNQFAPLLVDKTGEINHLKSLPESSPFLGCCVKLSFKERRDD